MLLDVAVVVLSAAETSGRADVVGRVVVVVVVVDGVAGAFILLE